MTDLLDALESMTRLFESEGLAFAVMGGFAVRVYAIPRPTFDIDFTLAVDRDQLPQLFEKAKQLGFTIPDEYERGWIDRVGGMPVIKIRHYLMGQGLDVGDILFTQGQWDESYLRKWAGTLRISERLERALEDRP